MSYNNSGTAKVKIVKNEIDPTLFTGKLLIKFQNILRNTTQVIVRREEDPFHFWSEQSVMFWLWK
jgi:hypothetical protein